MFALNQSLGDEISVFVHFELSAVGLGIRVVADGDENTCYGQSPFFMSNYVSQVDGAHLTVLVGNVADDDCIPDRFDLFMLEHSAGHDFRGAQGVPAVNQIYF